MSQSESVSTEGPTWTKQIQKNGEFVRKDTTFRNHVSQEASSEFPAEGGRYHLYVSYACPWAHRTLIMRGLKGLTAQISFDASDWLLPHSGWTFTGTNPGATKDSVNGKSAIREIYELASPGYEGSLTVPVLWDKKKTTIVNNESSEIIRMLNSEFNEIARRPEYDFYPEELRSEIDAINEWVYPSINNGVYRAGFARSQDAYESAVVELFDRLDRAEAILAERRYLTGGRLTEADIRLWTTLIRFDAVYVTHFKCNIRRLVDYPNLWGFTKELFAHPVFRETTHFDHIKEHYFGSHESVNPQHIVPVGPIVDYLEPHGREHLAATWFPAANA